MYSLVFLGVFFSKFVKYITYHALDIISHCFIGPVFGVSLEKAVERSGFQDKIELPRVVRESIIYIEEKGGVFNPCFVLTVVQFTFTNLFSTRKLK